MSIFSRITTWFNTKDINPSSLNGEFNNIVNPLNGLDSGSLTWNNVNATNAKITNLTMKSFTALSVPLIVASGRSVAATAAVASVATFTPGPSDASFIVSANVNVTASVTNSINVTVAYTDETNTPQTVTLNFQTTAGTLLTSITNVQGTGSYEGIPVHIRTKASTSITIATSGTFTSVTYNVEGVITQVR